MTSMVSKSYHDAVNVLKRHLGLKADWKVSRHQAKMLARELLLDEQYFAAERGHADDLLDRHLWLVPVAAALDASRSLPAQEKAAFDALWAEVIDRDWAGLKQSAVLTFIQEAKARQRAADLVRHQAQAAAAAAQPPAQDGSAVNFT